ncbi:MAG: hypothetical protein CUN55_04690 [Phototrophicales bacterium]|nr:MAG: hypothetical protein CUN55_04690 [Phototrophicales bacterium]
MTRQWPQNLNDNQPQVVAVLILLGVVALMMGGLYLAQSTTNITTARDINELQRQRSILLRENERLRAEIANYQSIDNLMTRAATLGFADADPDDIQYLIVDNYVYAQPTIVPTPIQPTPTPTNYEDNFAGWLARQFDALRKQFEEWAN